MLTCKPQYSLTNAKEYFSEHLCGGDYYSENNKIYGEWIGLAAARLGLSQYVQEDEFLRMCEGLHPKEEKTLTAKAKRLKPDAKKRIFYDFTISPPKSVSIVGVLRDDRVLDLHKKCVKIAMTELEQYASTRVRKDGKNEDRLTKNFACAQFTHETSRALDPAIHTHCIVFNTTYDEVEGQWKAIENQEMLWSSKLVNNLYYHELQKGLKKLGYGVEHTAKGFEIKGISRALIEKFSKRHMEILAATEEHIAEKGITGKNYAAVKEQVRLSTRERKIKNISTKDLKAMWAEELSLLDKTKLFLTDKKTTKLEEPNLGEATDWAESRSFERKSLARKTELMASILEKEGGKNFSIEELRAFLEERSFLHSNENKALITSEAVLAREKAIVDIAQNSQGTHDPLVEEFELSPTLTEEQAIAASVILRNRNFITLFQGKAGTGKSFTLFEIKQQLNKAGLKVEALAPQRQQSLDLQKDGFEWARTLSEALQRKDFREKSVILLDEAGQVGGKQMLSLLELAKEKDCRVILSGDTRQHGAVEASDALVAIEQFAGTQKAVLGEIRRQNPELAKDALERERIAKYRKAVELASNNQAEQSFEILEELSGVRNYDSTEAKQDDLANVYVDKIQQGEETLVVAQTWDEVNAINGCIRKKMQDSGLVDKKSTPLPFLKMCDMHEAERLDSRYYFEDGVIVFHKKCHRYKNGETATIHKVDKEYLHVVKENGKKGKVAIKDASSFSLAKRSTMDFSIGDKVITRVNDKKRKIVNGELLTVKSIGEDGGLVVEKTQGASKTLDKEHLFVNRGYCLTSYASQGKTVDSVLLSDSQNRIATSCKQWYVSISRGKKDCVVFTEDKEALRENIANLGERKMAIAHEPGFVRKGIGMFASWSQQQALAIKGKANRIIKGLETLRLEQKQNMELQQLQQRQSRGIKL